MIHIQFEVILEHSTFSYYFFKPVGFYLNLEPHVADNSSDSHRIRKPAIFWTPLHPQIIFPFRHFSSFPLFNLIFMTISLPFF